ncbi:MAG: DTW domain-containing protein YfiP [Candidatus Azotimanducaceae bacterium]|jgi:DTW domain-containing protein YfiP
MNIFLLTHQRERFKKTNTGSLVIDVLGEKAHIVVWDRVRPDPELLKTIAEGSTALLYPSIDSQLVTEASYYQNYIIIDGTWQEAQKIYNRSPYLKGLPMIEMPIDKPSAYNLRRNQREGCMCTAECAIEILKAKDFPILANDLQSMFLKHIASHSK